MNGGGRGAMIPLCRLWERTSAKGSVYLAGYLGQARVLVLKNRDRQSEADATHVVFLVESRPRGAKE